MNVDPVVLTIAPLSDDAGQLAGFYLAPRSISRMAPQDTVHSTLGTTSTYQASALPPPASMPTNPVVPQNTAPSSLDVAATPQASAFTAPASMPTNPVPSPGSDNLSNGVVAGVVVGCAVALSLLTFCVTYLWMRSRNNRRNDGRGGRHGSLRTSSRRSSRKDPETKQPIVTEEMSNIGARNSIQKYISWAADDKTVSNKVFGLLDNIAIHVENFYRNTSPADPSKTAAQLAQFNLPHLPESIVAMLQRSKTPETLITHCLTELIISAISPSGESTQSLLPVQFAAWPSTDLFHKGQETDIDRALFMSRMLSAYLHRNLASDSIYTSRRKDIIAQNARSFASAFSPWRSPKHSFAECVQSLTIIMESAAETGVWLFSQPCKFEFCWRSPAGINAKKVEKSPELRKVGDENGVTLDESRVIVESVVARV
ncbi:hypothetical protein MMC11_007721 [Xylographa trunciseda]|nr:hypothetical protein [Xylographa trunciseda]